MRALPGGVVVASILVLSAACSGGGGTSAAPSGGAPVSVTTATPSPTATPSATTAPSSGRFPSVAGCRIFPADNPWNTDVSAAPPNAPVEGGTGATGDRHVLVVDASACKLYEMYAAQYVGPGWHAGSGAVYDLASDALRPDYWTSSDAAGLPILAGLVGRSPSF